MDLKTNAELIIYYLNLLKIRKEEYIKNYKPTGWKALTQAEQLNISSARKHLDKLLEQEDLERRINFQALLRKHKAWKKYRINYFLKYKSKYTTCITILFFSKNNIDIFY